MGGQFPERVALGLSTEMLAELQQEAKRHGRTLLAQIRFFCEEGLRLSRKAESLDKRLSDLEQRLHAAEELSAYAKTRTPPIQKAKGSS